MKRNVIGSCCRLQRRPHYILRTFETEITPMPSISMYFVIDISQRYCVAHPKGKESDAPFYLVNVLFPSLHDIWNSIWWGVSVKFLLTFCNKFLFLNIFNIPWNLARFIAIRIWGSVESFPITMSPSHPLRTYTLSGLPCIIVAVMIIIFIFSIPKPGRLEYKYT